MDKLTRHAYVNTMSEAGRPEEITFKPGDIELATVWVNTFGNPTYKLYFKNEPKTLLCVDDYGAMNGLNHVRCMTVSRRKDL